MHMLLILHSHKKNLCDPSKVDAVVLAEFPSDIEHLELFEFVKTHMLHGPCGALNPVCPCITLTEIKMLPDHSSILNHYLRQQRLHSVPALSIEVALMDPLPA
jgi:hypothetical protein